MAGVPPPMDHNFSAGSFSFQQSSPLETLVRRTSSRRAVPSNGPSPQSSPIVQSRAGPSYLDRPSNLAITAEQPVQHRRPPSSPLLHTQFRSSASTYATYDDNSYIEHPSESSHASNEPYYNEQQHNEHQYNEQHYEDRDSLYSSASYYRNSFYPVAYEEPDPHARDAPSSFAQAATDEEIDLPTVVVSSDAPAERGNYHGSRASHDTFRSWDSSFQSKAPTALLTDRNFSRPVRPPPPPAASKRSVLERNAHRKESRENVRGPGSSYSYTQSTSSLSISQSSIPSTARSPTQTYRSTSPSSVDAASQVLSPNEFGHITYVESLHSSSSRSPSVRSASPATASPQLDASGMIPLPRGPPSIRDEVPASPYSSYSFYQMESAAPSPTDSSRQVTKEVPTLVLPQETPSRAATPSSNKANLENPQTAHDFLQLGISHHEENRLKDSAYCFERSATVHGGCGAGMLMWGLALRHGWGCEKNEKNGFHWLRKAAEIAVDDLNMNIEEVDDRKAVKSELILAIYEVGQCFFQGWGVPKDQTMAVNYFRTAAKLGDPDAQQDLGFCLANGKGCKKDRKEAAKWYRAAVAQGASDVGLAWIYKEKFN